MVPWEAPGIHGSIIIEKILPIQEDETGLVLWALWFHYDKFRDIEFAARQYENLVIRCGDFLASYKDGKTGLPYPPMICGRKNGGSTHSPYLRFMRAFEPQRNLPISSGMRGELRSTIRQRKK